ncbi:FAD-dependent oxidoreductase [Stackebrandtia nassauensis]|uniref:Monooxygenase FAD-binding protein n=1 Tax=Stackebrandtia nassauensis (strain DSM 44728 / CIP 108903 / NRRL B-16338 / NBRC 102104 / LLR-40K-21) TaxID=446470 RepID=D3PVH1_STANL|nr:FAD-dependent monooxygenase [Stackebrandtia nassauensis]ADD43085.1 monooxygenase FAD-binding protein [Stackebrandtia nassauensis DSM 44728]
MPTLPTETDVLIVGAGPVGLTLATALAQNGVQATLVDKLTDGANTSRAAVVHARTLEVLRDINISDDLVSRGVIVPHFEVRDRDRALLSVGFDKLPTPFPYTLMVPQNITEELLLTRLHTVGGEVHRPHEVTDITTRPDHVTATLTDGHQIRARYLIGCDGMHSTVREHSGIPFTGDTYAASFILADVHMTWSEPDDHVYLFFDPAGVMVVAPLPDGRHRIVATLDPAPEHPDTHDVQSLLDTRGPKAHPATIKDVVWSSRFRVHHRLADHYRADRILLAGDAAHVHSPAGGQGMNTGIQDAINLAEKLTAVLRDAAPSHTLDAYESERRPVAADVVAFTHRMTRIATLGNGPLRGLRNSALRALDFLPGVHHTLAMNLSELATTDRH